MLKWLYSNFFSDNDENKITHETIEEYCDIQQLFLSYNILYFEGILENVSIGWGENMRESVGACICDKNDCKIILNDEILQFRTNSDIASIIIHEMIHAYLFLTGIRERDDHGPKFMALAKKIGAEEGIEIRIYHTFYDEISYLYDN